MSKNWAICIGINDYKYVSPLKYARSDARRMRDFCQQELGFDRLFFFVEGAPDICLDDGYRIEASPRFGNLDVFLDAQFKARNFLNPQDNLWFFFAGHGLRSDGIDYLLPIDGNANRIEQTGLRIDYLSERLRRSGAGNIVLMLDACRSGDSRDAGLSGVGADAQQGVVTICSCGPNEQAYEIAELGEETEKGQGVFTYALLEGLRQVGPRNCATVDRLNGWLVRRVHELNEAYGKPRQTPVVKVDPAHKLHLVLLPDKATMHDTQPMRKAALLAEAEGELNFARQLWINVLAVVRADLEAICGLERVAMRRTKQSSVASTLRIDNSRSTSILERGICTKETTATKAEEIVNEEEIKKETNEQTVSIRFFEAEIVGLSGKVRKREEHQAKHLSETLGKNIELEMVWILGGESFMGAPNGSFNSQEKPQHWVSVDSFWMGKYPITQSQWKVVASLPKVNVDLELSPSSFVGDNLPVESVSWDEAIEFCRRLSQHSGKEYRLPSESEWEYACRAGTTTPFHFGRALTDQLANYRATEVYANEQKGRFREKTTAVGKFSSNAFGLHDMHGNVWEWCLDHWHDNYMNAPTNGNAWSSSNERAPRVRRGGSWHSSPKFCRSAFRGKTTPEYRAYNLGFRVSCSVPKL